MVRAQFGQAITTTGQVTLAGSIVCNTVMHGMVRSHSTRVNVIKGSVGLMPRNSKGVRNTSNKPFMEELPKVTIPLQGIGAPGPLLGCSKDELSFVAESPTVGCKVNREGLGKGSQADSKLGPGAGSKAPSKDTSSDSTVGDARGGNSATSMNSSSGGVRELTMRLGSHMPNDDVAK